MIDAQNFCHVEQVRPGVNVLFYADYDGDEATLHQVTVLTVGTIDMKVTMPADTFDRLWPENFRFATAAAEVLSVAAEMGFGPQEGTASPQPDHAGEIERLTAENAELRRKLEAAEVFEAMFKGHRDELLQAPTPQTNSKGAFIHSLSPEQLRIHEALCDSQYIAGVKVGWNAGCIPDPAEAQASLQALTKSREGHLEGYAEARAALATEGK